VKCPNMNIIAPLSKIFHPIESIVDESQADQSSMRESYYGPTNKDVDNESDSDIEFDILSNLEKLAEESLSNKDYAKAEQFLRKVLEKLRQGPERAPDGSRITQLRLALCCCLQGNWAAAESVLETMVKSRITHDLPVFYIMHAATLAHLEAGSLDMALSSCKTALQGRKRILGKSSREYLESLTLLAIVYERKGDVLEAEAVRHSLPNRDRTDGSDIMLGSLDYLFLDGQIKKLVCLEEPDSASGDNQQPLLPSPSVSSHAWSTPNLMPTEATRSISRSSYNTSQTSPSVSTHLNVAESDNRYESANPDRQAAEHHREAAQYQSRGQVAIGNTLPDLQRQTAVESYNLVHHSMAQPPGGANQDSKSTSASSSSTVTIDASPPVNVMTIGLSLDVEGPYLVWSMGVKKRNFVACLVS